MLHSNDKKQAMTAALKKAADSETVNAQDSLTKSKPASSLMVESPSMEVVTTSPPVKVDHQRRQSVDNNSK